MGNSPSRDDMAGRVGCVVRRPMNASTRPTGVVEYRQASSSVALPGPLSNKLVAVRAYFHSPAHCSPWAAIGRDSLLRLMQRHLLHNQFPGAIRFG